MKFAFRFFLPLTIACVLLQARDSQAQNSIFKSVPTPNENFNNDLFASSASSPNDIWAVGEEAIHFDGTQWTAAQVPMIKGTTSELNGVLDLSPTEAWAAGIINIGEGDTNQIIEKWDGTQWSVFPGPSFASGDQPSLFGMSGTSGSDIWAVGFLLAEGGDLLEALFEHFDGTQWTATELIDGTPFLVSVSADATNDAWAVGYNEAVIDEDATLALHWNGTTWTPVSTPNVGSGNNQLNSVVALAPNNVWAVGLSTPQPPPQSPATLTLIEHFDGTSWSVVPSPNVGPANNFQSNRLFGITANSPTDIWAFGSYFASDGSGHQMTLLEHWNGTSWTIQPSPNPHVKPRHGTGFLADILTTGVVPSPGNVWIFGTEDEAPHEGSLAINTLPENSWRTRAK